MSRYTTTVFEILQWNAEPGERITNLADMTNISKRTLFKDAPLDVIHGVATDYFVRMFTLHYLKYELGCETFSLWQLELAEKLINNSYEINEIFDKQLEQAYSEYQKRTTDAEGQRTKIANAQDVRAENGSQITNASNISNGASSKIMNAEQIANANSSNIQSNNLKDVMQESGSNVQIKGGKDTSKDLGTQTQKENSVDAQSYGSQSVSTYNSNDKTNYNSTDTTTFGSAISDMKNTQQIEKNRKVYELEHEKSFDNRQNERTIAGKVTDEHDNRVDNNAMSFSFDTPQGSLDDLRDPGGVPGSGSGSSAIGKGIDYAAGQSYNYFSAAGENDGTQWDKGKTERSYSNDYKETDALKGKEITKDKYNIDGQTHKDEHDVLTKYGDDTTATITIGERTVDLHGDVTAKQGIDSVKKSGDDDVQHRGSDSVAKSGIDSLSKIGNSVREDDLTHEVEYGSSITDSRGVKTTSEKSGSVSDVANAANHITDAQDENIKTSNNDIRNENKTDQSNSTMNHAGTEWGNDSSNVTEIIGKVNFEKWLSQPNVLSKLWKIFDDLFCWLEN